MKLPIITILLLLLCSDVRGQECIPLDEAPTCGCTLSSSREVIDLRSLGLQNNQPYFKVEDKDKGYTYTYNPCYPFTVGSGCTNVAGCQQDSGNGRALGKQTKDDIAYNIVGKDLVITYSGGVDGRSFDVTLKCTQTGKNTFEYNEENPPKDYKFTLTSPCACPDECKGGSSSSSSKSGGGTDPGVVGIVLLSVFVFAVVVYFVAGIIIKRVKFNKTGTDVIPNKEFWFTLPFLVKDGVLFTFSPCIKWWENRRSGYSSVK